MDGSRCGVVSPPCGRLTWRLAYLQNGPANTLLTACLLLSVIDVVATSRLLSHSWSCFLFLLFSSVMRLSFLSDLLAFPLAAAIPPGESKAVIDTCNLVAFRVGLEVMTKATRRPIHSPPERPTALRAAAQRNVKSPASVKAMPLEPGPVCSTWQLPLPLA